MVRYATVGTGWIVDSFIEAAEKTPELKLNAVYSRTAQRAEEFALKHGVEYTATELESLAKSDLIDAVYIASPNAFHVEQSLLFLKNHKHVICEKPIAPTLKEAKKLIETARENNVIFMEAMMSFNSPQFELLKSAVMQLGDVRQAEFTFCQLSSKYPALLNGLQPNIFNPKMKTGAAMDIGIYCVYPAVALFGQPNGITASAVKLENGIDICGNACLSYDDGEVSLRYSKVGNSRGVSEIVGDKGTITIDKISYLDGIKYYDNDGKMTTLHKNADGVLPMQFEAEQFYNYITNFNLYSKKYEQANHLAMLTCDVLEFIRRESKVSF